MTTSLETYINDHLCIEGLAKAITASGLRNMTAEMLRRRLLALGDVYLPFAPGDDVRDAEACTLAINDLEHYHAALMQQHGLTELAATEWMVSDFTGEVEDELLAAITGGAAPPLAMASA